MRISPPGGTSAWTPCVSFAAFLTFLCLRLFYLFGGSSQSNCTWSSFCSVDLDRGSLDLAAGPTPATSGPACRAPFWNGLMLVPMLDGDWQTGLCILAALPWRSRF